jgi:hypothetical protein
MRPREGAAPRSARKPERRRYSRSAGGPVQAKMSFVGEPFYPPTGGRAMIRRQPWGPPGSASRFRCSSRLRLVLRRRRLPRPGHARGWHRLLVGRRRAGRQAGNGRPTTPRAALRRGLLGRHARLAWPARAPALGRRHPVGEERQTAHPQRVRQGQHRRPGGLLDPLFQLGHGEAVEAGPLPQLRLRQSGRPAGDASSAPGSWPLPSLCRDPLRITAPYPPILLAFGSPGKRQPFHN